MLKHVVPKEERLDNEQPESNKPFLGVKAGLLNIWSAASCMYRIDLNLRLFVICHDNLSPSTTCESVDMISQSSSTQATLESKGLRVQGGDFVYSPQA